MVLMVDMAVADVMVCGLVARARKVKADLSPPPNTTWDGCVATAAVVVVAVVAAIVWLILPGFKDTPRWGAGLWVET